MGEILQKKPSLSFGLKSAILGISVLFLTNDAAAEPLVHPSDPPALAKGLNEAAGLILEEHPRRAVALLVRFEKIYPDYDMVHFLLGLAYGKLDKNERAVSEERRALSLNPKNEAARVSYGIALGNTGHFRKEIRQERQALALNSRDEAAWQALGWAYASLSKWKLARAAEEKALSLNSSDPSAYMVLGVSLAHLGFVEEGLSEEARGARLAPEDQGIKRAIAWISGILHPLRSGETPSPKINPLLAPDKGNTPQGAPNILPPPGQNLPPGSVRAPATAH